MTVSTYFIGLLATLILATGTWVISLFKRDVSIVDSLWSLMFLGAAMVYSNSVEAYTSRSSLILSLILLWTLRLTFHISWRNWGEPEDRRYRAIREKYEPHFALKSLGIIFIFQAVLAWIISMPLWAALTVPIALHPLDVLAVTLWTIGMAFETVGDWQLSRFLADPKNKGNVMDRGLWRYSRHPNYFGECLVWWGFYLFAIPVGAWWAGVAPLLLTFLLLRFSGVALLEKSIVERRPAYREYIARTNALVPGPPKKTRIGSNSPGQELS